MNKVVMSVEGQEDWSMEVLRGPLEAQEAGVTPGSM